MKFDKDATIEKRRAGLRVTAAVLAGVSAAALAGCATTEATPQNSPTATHSSEAPNPTETQAPTPEHVFSGTINLESFTGEAWAEKDRIEKVDTCNEEFFTPNLEGDPVLTVTSTAQEIATVFAHRLELLNDLASDRSDPLNGEAANNIAECLTSDITVNGATIERDNLQSNVGSVVSGNIEGTKIVYLDPATITRHSEGLFAAQTTDNLYYDAFTIEGHLNNGIGSSKGTLVAQYYEWSPAEYQYSMMLTSVVDDTEVKSHFGTKPPVVVDPSRSEAPVADF